MKEENANNDIEIIDEWVLFKSKSGKK